MILLKIVNLGGSTSSSTLYCSFLDSKACFESADLLKIFKAGVLIFLQKSWGLPVTCCGQSVNPAATYSAFLHSSRVIFYSYGILGLIFDFCSISLL